MIVALFSCFEADPKAQNSHYLMKALMRCFNIIDVRSVISSLSFFFNLEWFVMLKFIRRKILMFYIF